MPRSTGDAERTPLTPDSEQTLQCYLDQQKEEKQKTFVHSKIKMADLPIKSLKNYSQPSPSGVPTGLAMPAIQASKL